MGRIKIIEEHIDETPRPPVYVLERKKTLEGSQVNKILNTESGRIKPCKVTIPDKCPLCLTEGKVVRQSDENIRFRCLLCGHKWG